MYTLTSLNFKHVSNTRRPLYISEQLEVWTSTWWVMKLDWAFIGRWAWVAARLNSLSESFMILWWFVASLASTVRRHWHATVLLLLLGDIAASNSVAWRCIGLNVVIIATAAISHLVILLLLEIVSIPSLICIHVTLLECWRVVVSLTDVVVLPNLVRWSELLLRRTASHLPTWPIHFLIDWLVTAAKNVQIATTSGSVVHLDRGSVSFTEIMFVSFEFLWSSSVGWLVLLLLLVSSVVASDCLLLVGGLVLVSLLRRIWILLLVRRLLLVWILLLVLHLLLLWVSGWLLRFFLAIPTANAPRTSTAYMKSKPLAKCRQLNYEQPKESYHFHNSISCSNSYALR